MTNASGIKKKLEEDHIFGIFNPEKKEFVKISDQSSKNSNRMSPDSNNLSAKKQPKGKYDSSISPNSRQKSHPIPKNLTAQSNQPKTVNKEDHKQVSPNKRAVVTDSSIPKHPLSSEDKERQKIAKSNHDYVRNHLNLISKNIQTIYETDHTKIQGQLRAIESKFEHIYINNHSTIWTAIDLHNRGYKHIYLLNFADSLKPGGGYLNGRGAQEETLCRQTLLYPTICNNPIYKDNQKYGAKGSNNMIYSADVLVIRDDNYKFINDQFHVNIISASAVDNRKKVENNAQIMEDRIRKIITLAAVKTLDEKIQGKNALILGAFGCGVFNNDPNLVASLFANVLHKENLKIYFNCIVFPIYKDNGNMIPIFNKHLI